MIVKKTWIIGDTHFGYNKVAKERNFDTILDHDMAIASSIANVVEPFDTLIINGDLCSRYANEQDYRQAFETMLVAYNKVRGTVYHRLPFDIIINMGNHDKYQYMQKMIDQGFIKELHGSMDFRVNKDAYIRMTHIPINVKELNSKTFTKLNVHAHTHSFYIDDEKYFCSSWDIIKEPIELKTLIDKVLNRLTLDAMKSV